MTQVELAHMTWKQAAAARDRGAVVLITVGTLEQNGLVCPLATDTLIAFEVAKRTAQETGAVVVPPINYGYSDHHAGFPGTVSIRPETLTALVGDVCEQLVESGFDHLMLVNDHRTNDPPLEHAADRIRSQHGILMGSFSPRVLAEAVSKDLYPGGGAHGHGDDSYASLLLSFTPDSVYLGEGQSGSEQKQFEGLPLAGSGKVKVGGVTFGLFLHQRDTTKTGGNADPALVDAVKGAEVMRRVVAAASDCVRAFAKLRTRDRR